MAARLVCASFCSSQLLPQGLMSPKSAWPPATPTDLFSPKNPASQRRPAEPGHALESPGAKTEVGGLPSGCPLRVGEAGGARTVS